VSINDYRGELFKTRGAHFLLTKIAAGKTTTIRAISDISTIG